MIETESRGIELSSAILIVIVIVAVVAGGSLVLLEGEEGEREGGSEWATYTNQEYHYKIQYPSGWTKEVLYQGAMLDLKSTGARNRTLGLSITQSYENPLENFVEDTIHSLEAQAKYEGATFSIENTTLGGREAKSLDIQNLSWTIEGKEYDIQQKYVITFIQVNGANHPLTLLFTAEKNDGEAWDTILPQIIEDFKFT